MKGFKFAKIVGRGVVAILKPQPPGRRKSSPKGRRKSSPSRRPQQNHFKGPAPIPVESESVLLRSGLTGGHLSTTT